MTTLIIDFNTKAVYADSRTTSSKDGTVAKEFDEDCKKIHHLPDGKVLVGCGCYDTIKKTADNLLSLAIHNHIRRNSDHAIHNNAFKRPKSIFIFNNKNLLWRLRIEICLLEAKERFYSFPAVKVRIAKAQPF